MQTNKIFSLMGLAMRAGKIASGEFATEKAIKTRKAYLVIVANDASDNTRKSFSDSCSYYHVPIRFFGVKESLGSCIGKQFRASLAVLDEGFARELMKHMDNQNNMEV